MKKKFSSAMFLFVLSLVTGVASSASAAGTNLRWSVFNAMPQVFSDANYSYCGAPIVRNIEAHFGCTNCKSSTCPTKRYEYTFVLYKDGVPIETRVDYSQTGSGTVYWQLVTMEAGVYRVGVSSRVKDFGCLTYHTLENNVMSNSITVTATNGEPVFTINGVTPQPDYTPIVVPPGCITMNARATSCETNYYLGVSESDYYLNRTYDYEWGLWFSGEAPNGINIQNRATAYSYYDYGYVGSAARQGSTLIGGNLPPAFGGAPRYYRVALCVGPVWTCKTALVKVDNNLACKATSNSEAKNEYTGMDDSEGQQPTE